MNYTYEDGTIAHTYESSNQNETDLIAAPTNIRIETHRHQGYGFTTPDTSLAVRFEENERIEIAERILAGMGLTAKGGITVAPRYRLHETVTWQPDRNRDLTVATIAAVLDETTYAIHADSGYIVQTSELGKFGEIF